MRIHGGSACQIRWAWCMEHPHCTITHFTYKHYVPRQSSFSGIFFSLKFLSLERSFVSMSLNKSCASTHSFLTSLRRTIARHWTSTVHKRIGKTKYTHKGEVRSARRRGRGLIPLVPVVLTYSAAPESGNTTWLSNGCPADTGRRRTVRAACLYRSRVRQTGSTVGPERALERSISHGAKSERSPNLVAIKVTSLIKTREDLATNIRLITDVRRSGGNAKVPTIVVFPELADLVDSIVNLLVYEHGGDNVGYNVTVADIEDAFRTLALRESDGEIMAIARSQGWPSFADDVASCLPLLWFGILSERQLQGWSKPASDHTSPEIETLGTTQPVNQARSLCRSASRGNGKCTMDWSQSSTEETSPRSLLSKFGR